VKYVSVEKGSAEPVRRRLMLSGHLDPSRQIIREKDLVLFPVLPDTPTGIGEIVERVDDRLRDVQPRWYGDIVDLPDGLKALLPRSLDMIGHIAILKIPDELMPRAGDIADAILACNRSIRTVALDEGVHGEERLRTLKLLRGQETETEHVEYGTRLRVDPTKVFFTPRLGFERWRVASLIAPFEKVLDMFAGVGPFALHICRRVPSAEVYAVDSNPNAVEYMKTNAKLNKVDNLRPMQGKIEDVIHTLPSFDRVIMNLPMRSVEYLNLALMKVDGGWIHVYRIVEGMKEPEAVEDLKKRIEALGRSTDSISSRQVKTYAPGVEFLSFDVKVTPT
jgi:tRNA (guanine37-N1)-methyltransferase